MKTTAILDSRTKRVSNRYPIYIRISNGQSVTHLPTGYKIETKHWGNGVVKKSHPEASIINARIADIISDVRRTEAECLLKGIPFSLDLLGKEKKSYDFVDSVKRFAGDYLNEGNFVMHKRYMILYRNLYDFYETLNLERIDDDLIRDLVSRLKEINNPNTIHKKIKMLGAVLKEEIRRKRYNGINAFLTYKIKTVDTKRGYLSTQEIALLENAALPDQLALTRDMFMFSYYTQGQRFGDVLLCRRDQINAGRIYFAQHKTSMQLSVHVHEKLQEIIDRYEGEYIFPIVKKTPKDSLERFRVIGMYNTIANRNLKIIAEMIQIQKFSFHWARYSFASGLMEHTDSIHVIKQALGHKKYATTEIYLKKLLNKTVDQEVIKLFSNTKGKNPLF